MARNRPEIGVRNPLQGTGAPTPAPPAQKPSTAAQIATFLGILQGDQYDHAELPADAPTHKDNGGYHYGPTTGTDVLARATANDAQNKAVEFPDNGSTIYSGSFAHDLLNALNLPGTAENVRAINAWMKAETGDQGPDTPRFNPLATTQKFGGYTIFNKVGVKNYDDYHTGVMATANVLVNGKYNDILAAFARGNDAVAVGRAVEASPWGTGGGVLRVLGAR
jgi:hypothetical protein